MPRLFELYVYQQMLKFNNFDKTKIKYQFGTYGNFLDILVNDGENSMIIDAKYKLHYEHKLIHEDIRQVSGYARLKKVRKELGFYDRSSDIDNDKHINCLIVYPQIERGIEDFSLENFHVRKVGISAYHNVFKLGVKLPLI